MSKTIMIVDDSPEILTLFDSFLKRRGYSVIKTLDSASALEFLKEYTPDLFILDVMMAGINGIELCERVRVLPEHEHTPILIVSAYSDSGIVEQAFAAGANDYVIKPVDTQVLRDKIEDLLGVTEE